MADFLGDPNLMRAFQEMQRIHPVLQASASIPRGQQVQSLAEKVKARCEFAYLGFSMAAFGGSPLAAKGFVPLQNPPVPSGIMHCVNELKRIVIKDYDPTKAKDFRELPSLIRRIRHLIRVYYDCIITERQNPEMLFCDFKNMFEVSVSLHRVGLYLQLDPRRLKAFMNAGGRDAETLVLDEPLDIGQWRVIATKLEKEVENNEEADDDDRERVGQISEQATEDFAAHMMSWFFADMNVAFLLNDPQNDREREWARKSAERLVRWSTSDTWRDVLGDPLTDSMRPIYWDEKALVRFSHAGGLGALYGDWVNSSASKLCEDALAKLPVAVWENQTKASLFAITLQLENRISREASDAAAEPIFVDACYNIYKRYGLNPFSIAAKRETWRTSIIFYFIAHRIKKEQLKMETREDWRNLLDEFVNLPESLRRRYSWANYTISGKWDCLKYYGCSYEECPEKQALFKLRDERVKGVRDPDVEERLNRWGAKARACGGCLATSYCSTECQKAHWPTHKAKCRKRKVGFGKRATIMNDIN